MEPSDLRAESFSHYPAQAKSLAIENLPVLRRIPLTVLPLLLRQLIDYDWLFPPERRDLIHQLEYLAQIPAPGFDALMKPFAAISLSTEIRRSNWVDKPGDYIERLSAYLWSSRQIDAYRSAAQTYQQQVGSAQAKMLNTSRLTMVVIGAGVKETSLPLFRQLRPHGTLFTHLDSTAGLTALIDAVKERSERYLEEYAHWYIDGGEPEPIPESATAIKVVSYARLAPAVRRELSILNQFVTHPPATGTTGVEATTSYMAEMNLRDVGMAGEDADPILRHFELNVLTEGSGTQVYSTTFVQWTGRECLRRAQPLTLLARFKPRQQAATMNQLLTRDPFSQTPDPEGSLVDADMGAYLTWVDQSRLPGAEQSQFLAWFEGHGTAVAIGPSMARGATSHQPANLAKVLEWIA